jgi:hypothetical protein
VRRVAVSSVIGAVLLIAVAVGAMAIVTIVLLSGPLPTKVPSISATIRNKSYTIYISHEGGDSLSKGQYMILVDGSDETANFSKSFNDPWSAGKIMNDTVSTPSPPRRVVMIYTGAGGGGTVLFAADFTATVTLPPHMP